MGVIITALVSLAGVVLGIHAIAEALNWIAQRLARHHRKEHR